jgi:hypothetical protein
VEESGYGVVLSQHLPEETEENLENPQVCQQLGPHEYEELVLTIYLKYSVSVYVPYSHIKQQVKSQFNIF